MHIDPADTVAGVGILTIRRMLQSTREYLTLESAAKKLKMPEASAYGVLHDMETRGYLEPTDRDAERRFWRLTDLGQSLRLASARKPITRATAERQVAAFLGRVDALNADNRFLYRVRSVRVFGSYITSAPRLGDIDLIIDLEPRVADREMLLQLAKERAGKSGRHFGSYLAVLAWPSREVLLYLRKRSPFLSFHTPDDPVATTVTANTLYMLRESGPTT